MEEKALNDLQKLPPTYFYIARMAEINKAEYQKNFHAMFRLLLITSDTFHKKDREKCKNAREAFEKYIEVIEATNGRNYNHTLQLRGQRAAHLFNKGGRMAKMEVFDTMWEGNYIDKAAFNSFSDIKREGPPSL